MPTASHMYQRWNAFDLVAFEKALACHLSQMELDPASSRTSQQALDAQADRLTGLVSATLNETLPLVRTRPHAKRWWDDAVLNPLQAEAQRLRRASQRHQTPHVLQLYKAASQAF